MECDGHPVIALFVHSICRLGLSTCCICSYALSVLLMLDVTTTTALSPPILSDSNTTSVNSSSPTQLEEHHNSLKEENCTRLSSPKVLTRRDTSEARGTSSRSDAVTSYYDFIINEGSYKFWAVFQVATAVLLIYSAFAAVYYAKYTFATTDYSDYDDDFFFRRSGTAYVTPAPPSTQSFLGLSPETFQRIMNALSSKNYS